MMLLIFLFFVVALLMGSRQDLRYQRPPDMAYMYGSATTSRRRGLLGWIGFLIKSVLVFVVFALAATGIAFVPFLP